VLVADFLFAPPVVRFTQKERARCVYNGSMPNSYTSGAAGLANPQFPDKYYDDPTGIDRYVVQEKVLFAWQGPSKIDKKKKRQEIAQIILLAIILILILSLLQEYLLTVVLAMFTVLYLMFETSPPLLLQYQITTIGLKIEDKYYYWPQLSQFWFEDRQETRILMVRNLFPRVQVMKLIIRAEDEDEIKTSLGKYLLYKKPTQTSLEKFLHRASAYLPLDLDPF